MSSDSAIPTTQKAWMVVKRGKPRDALVLKTDVPVPKPKQGEVLVRVRAAALNPMCAPPSFTPSFSVLTVGLALRMNVSVGRFTEGGN